MTPYLLPKFVKHIDLTSIKTLFQLGAHDGSDTVDVLNFYKPSQMLVFECNPLLLGVCGKTVDECRERTKLNVEFVGKAAHTFPCQLKYWKVVGDNIYDMVNSSVYKHHYLPMEEIVVPATSIDHECELRGIESIDLICSDIEGNEMNAFTNQKILHKTKYIITEAGFSRDWKPGYPVLEDLQPLLEGYGFRLAELHDCHGGLGGEVLFVNQNI